MLSFVIKMSYLGMCLMVEPFRLSFLSLPPPAIGRPYLRRSRRNQA